MISNSQISDPSQALKAKELLLESSLMKEVNVSVDPLFPLLLSYFYFPLLLFLLSLLSHNPYSLEGKANDLSVELFSLCTFSSRL